MRLTATGSEVVLMGPPDSIISRSSGTDRSLASSIASPISSSSTFCETCGDGDVRD
jgi:hypothetical protein